MRPEGMPIIRPDLIPITSWGSSLSNLLTKPSWDSIRHPMIGWAGGCQICLTQQGNSLECHEVWAYSMPPLEAPKETVGVQRLMAVAVLCKDCHSMFHLGRARVIGTISTVKRRLKELNQWSESDYKQYDDQQGKLGAARAEWNWVLDVSLVHKVGPLVIKTGDGFWSCDDGGFLTAPPKYGDGECFTAIFGASYKVGLRVIEAEDPSEAVKGLLQEEGDFTFAEWVRTHRPHR